MRNGPKEKAINPNQKRVRLILSTVSLVALVAASIVTSGIVSTVSNNQTPVAPMSLPAKPGYYKVSYVSDGDTFAVNMDGHEEKVRMIGVDTPETVKPNSPTECYGKKASDFLKSRLTGKTVRLESDPINQNRDRYDRLLRYAYDENNVLLNKQIIEEGYGFAYLSFPFSKAEDFRLAQVDARQQNKGVWSGECTINDPDSARPKTNQL